MGLQDNGSAVITPAGKQIEAYGGDGFYVAVDPDNSGTWYEEYTNGDINVTTDGGKTWSSAAPDDVTGALFAAPFVMDRTSAKHLVAGGRYVSETTTGVVKNEVTGTPVDPVLYAENTVDWTQVYDLGTRTKPGVAGAQAGDGDPDNALSAVDTRGERDLRRLLRVLRHRHRRRAVRQRHRDQRRRQQGGQGRHRRRLAHRQGRGPAEALHQLGAHRPGEPADGLRHPRRLRPAVDPAGLARRRHEQGRQGPRVRLHRRRRDVPRPVGEPAGRRCQRRLPVQRRARRRQRPRRRLPRRGQHHLEAARHRPAGRAGLPAEHQPAQPQGAGRRVVRPRRADLVLP